MVVYFFMCVEIGGSYKYGNDQIVHLYDKNLAVSAS